MLHIPDQHFRTFDLTPDDLIRASIVFTLIILFVFALGLIQFSKENRRLSWVISLLGSSSMTALGIIYLSKLIPQFPGIFFMDTSVDKTLLLAVDNYAAYVCLWFALINFFDLLFGFIFYRKYLDPLTALVHHPIFIWIMYNSCTGRGFITGPNAPYARLFMLMSIEEVPTFLLALGAVFPAFRSDLGFGGSFFALRLVYHIYFFVYALKLGVPNVVVGLLILTTSLHAFWFKNWAVKYGKKFLDGQKKRE